jgi:hypothetical protein
MVPVLNCSCSHSAKPLSCNWLICCSDWMPKVAWVKNRAASAALGRSLAAGALGAAPPEPGRPEPCTVATGSAEGAAAEVGVVPVPEVLLLTPAGVLPPPPPPPPPHAANAASASVDSAAGARRGAVADAVEGGWRMLLEATAETVSGSAVAGDIAGDNWSAAGKSFTFCIRSCFVTGSAILSASGVSRGCKLVTYG